MKNSYPIQIAKYVVQRHIIGDPVFAWWIQDVLSKRNGVIGKMKSNDWVPTHKFGIKIPKSVQETKTFDKENRNTLQWDSICK